MTDDETEAALARMEAQEREQVERGRRWLVDEHKRTEADHKRMLELLADSERRPANPDE
jgi:hypothetical protein